MPAIPCEYQLVAAEELTHTEFNASVELALSNIQQQQDVFFSNSSSVDIHSVAIGEFPNQLTRN